MFIKELKQMYEELLKLRRYMQIVQGVLKRSNDADEFYANALACKDMCEIDWFGLSAPKKCTAQNQLSQEKLEKLFHLVSNNQLSIENASNYINVSIRVQLEMSNPYNVTKFYTDVHYLLNNVRLGKETINVATDQISTLLQSIEDAIACFNVSTIYKKEDINEEESQD